MVDNEGEQGVRWRQGRKCRVAMRRLTHPGKPHLTFPFPKGEIRGLRKVRRRRSIPTTECNGRTGDKILGLDSVGVPISATNRRLIITETQLAFRRL
ncbi:hypothetical protein GW17_00049007 [Ensete ventricosum]|nr:hypothetical protein GW17_00049007 [Ensete ventricosum]